MAKRISSIISLLSGYDDIRYTILLQCLPLIERFSNYLFTRLTKIPNINRKLQKFITSAFQ